MSKITSRKNDFVKKLLNLSKDIENYPKFKPEYYLRLSRAYRISDMPKNSLEYIHKAYNIKPKDPYILNEIGRVYMDLKNYHLALKYFTKALQVDKFNTEYKLDIANVYDCLNKPMISKKILEDILKKEKDNSDALALLGIIYGKYFKKYLKAIRLLKKALKIQPNNHPAQVGLARALIETDKFSEAKVILKKALKSHKKCRPSFINFGQIYEHERKYNKALELFLKAQKIEDNEFIRIKIAHCSAILYYKKKSYKKVIQILNPILLKAPQFCDGYTMIGDSYYHLKKIDKAINVFKRQIKHCRVCGRGEFNLGELYFLQKNYKLAKKYFLMSKKEHGSKQFLPAVKQYLTKIDKKLVGTGSGLNLRSQKQVKTNKPRHYPR